MNTLRTLSFSDLEALAKPVTPPPFSDNFHVKVDQREFGQIDATLLQSGSITAVSYKADLQEDLCIQYNEEQMLQSMNICFSFQGDVDLQLKQSNFSATLAPFQHHCLFAPETEYDIRIKKNTQGFHLAVDLEYYMSLLCEHDAGTARLKERIGNRERVWMGTGKTNAAMKQALSDIFCNPLTGKLRSMLVEAKVLEIIALQLSQFAEGKPACPITKADVETFHALKEFLNENFAAELSLKSLSRTFGLNEFKLKKGFRELFQTTIFEYIHDLKMAHAHNLLLDSHMYVNEVATQIGYKNPNHFSTAFKRKFGISPTALK
jgi:AraC-like DNA-binding protein